MTDARQALTQDTGYGEARPLTDGPFKGWLTWGEGQDPYETAIGPFCFRERDDGEIEAAFMPERKHLNGAGAIHGGCLMSFADFALFAIARRALEGRMSVTLTFNSEFLAAGDLGAPVYARGTVMRAGRSVVFVQAALIQRDAAILAFSGTLKVFAPRGAG